MTTPFTPSQAATVGISRSGLYRGTRDGRFRRIARGLYVSSEAPAADWDMLEAVSRRKEATICLTSALAAHDLTDDIPDRLNVAIRRGARTPVTDHALAWHHFDSATFDTAREQRTIPGTEQRIGIYSAERSIVDAFRLRGHVGYETARDALKEWLHRGGKPTDILAVAGDLPRARGPLIQALEVLA